MIIIFWDYDGTLVDTEILYKKSIESYLENKNYLLKGIPDEYFYKNISGTHPESYITLLQKDGYIKSNISVDPNEIKKYYTLYFSSLSQGEVKITKNIDLLIKKLANIKDIIMCITSSSFIRDFSLKHKNLNNKILNKYFNIDKNVYLCGSIENCNFKPSPDIFVYALNDIVEKYSLNLTTKDKLFIIEDSIAGYRAGLNFKELMKNKVDVIVIRYFGALNNDYDLSNEKCLNNQVEIVAKNTKELYKLIKLQ